MARQSEHWRAIRARRARPAGLAAASNDRKLVLQAALAQAEELWDAAAATGPRSRALPLFYCLSQAGRAICAAWYEGVEWQPRGHGLSGEEPAAGVMGSGFVAGYGARISGGERGSFGMVAEATGSPTFTGTATVAQLWTSMPTFPTPRVLVGEGPRCLYVEAATAAQSGQSVMEAVLGPTQAVVRKRPDSAPELLALYPTAVGYDVVGERPSLIEGMDPDSIVAFPAEGDRPRSLRDVAERVPDEGDSPLGRTFVFRPRVGEEQVPPPSQLMTLWGLLFSLSQLTRYYPAAWVGALNDDNSEVAVTLDHGLELALALVPQLIAEALGIPRRLLEEHPLALRRDPQGADAPTGQP